jgi:hypothetical protein
MEKETMNGILRLKEEIDQTSDELRREASRIKGDVIAVRNDPKVQKIWNKLCRLHMKAMVICEFDSKNVRGMEKVCEAILHPTACIETLHLSEEETCCGRFLKRIGAEKG